MIKKIEWQSESHLHKKLILTIIRNRSGVLYYVITRSSETNPKHIIEWAKALIQQISSNWYQKRISQAWRNTRGKPLHQRNCISSDIGNLIKQKFSPDNKQVFECMNCFWNGTDFWLSTQDLLNNKVKYTNIPNTFTAWASTLL